MTRTTLWRAALWLVAAAVASSACQQPYDQPAHVDVSSLKAADAALQQAIASRDVDRTAAFYAPDATLLPAAEPSIAGREAIRREWASLFAIPAFKNTAALTDIQVARSGDLAYTRGTYVTDFTGADGKPAAERGKWLSIWKRQADGSWRILVDTYNTDTPPPEHARSLVDRK